MTVANTSNGKETETATSTIIIVPRERFTLAIRSLNSVIKHTPPDVPVVYVDAGSPKKIGLELKSICQAHGYKYLRYDEFLSPNQARNIGTANAQTDLVVFIDNDVIVSEGWLEAMEACALETGAEVVAPLTCQREPLHSEVHQAGGRVFDNFEAFMSGRNERPHIEDVHLLQGKSVSEVGEDRTEVECCEFHCVMVRKDVFDRIGPLDEKLLATKEHIDFSLSVWQAGGRVMLEPKSVVTYLFPDRSNPLQMADWRYFLLRWSPEWQSASLQHFKEKWSLDGDPYFEKRKGLLDWRYREGVAKPIIRKVPMVGRKYRFTRFGQSLIVPMLKAYGRRLVNRHAKQNA